ncbi:MAG: hypothetical protein ACWA5X_13660 [bacterium]
MNTSRKLFLGVAATLLFSGSASALEISSPVSNLSNLWYHSQDSQPDSNEFGFSPDTGDYRDGGRSTVAWDYWDHEGIAPSMISGSDFLPGSTLTLSILGSAQPAAGDPLFDANGQTSKPDHLGLTLSAVIGAWATEVSGSDDSFTALDLDPGAGTLFDFNVGSSFSSIIPENAVALFLGYNSTVAHFDSILASDSGATLQDFFTVNASVTSPVPVPAGGWLLFSALAAVGGRKFLAKKLER